MIITSIIIPNWNTTGELSDCVEAIYNSKLKLSYEIIVVDNASIDGFKDWIAIHPEIRYIENIRNMGFSIAINQGLLISEGKYACFLNSDTKPAEGWLDYMVEYLESHPECGLVAPFGENVCCKEQARSNDTGQDVEIVGHTIPFMCVVIPKYIFTKIGFPVIYYGEDVEFCNRLRSNKYKTVIVSKSFVSHLGSQCWVINNIGRNQAVQLEFARNLLKKWLGENV